MSQSSAEPHPGAASFAVATMAVAVAAALVHLGPLRQLDHSARLLVEGFGLEGEMRPLPPWVEWAWILPVTYGLCWAVLHVPGHWRRIVLSVGVVILTLAWVPVLALAGFAAPVGASMVALVWACVGSLIYAARHRELDEPH